MNMKKLTVFILAMILCFAAACAFADVYDEAGFIKKIPMPKKYRQEAEYKGTVEKITYTCPSYAEMAVTGEEKIVEKDLYVYLPYGEAGRDEENDARIAFLRSCCDCEVSEGNRGFLITTANWR